MDDGNVRVDGKLGNTLTVVTVDETTVAVITSNVIQLQCTGAETVTTLTGGVSGQLLTIIHDDSDCTINDTDNNTADQIDMLGSNNDLAGAADLIVQLVYNDVHWFAVSESAN